MPSLLNPQMYEKPPVPTSRIRIVKFNHINGMRPWYMLALAINGINNLAKD